MSTPDTQAELEQLRARVADLEAQLAEKDRATSALVAQSQEKLYWLERWNVDLEKVMGRRSAQVALESLKKVRSVVWAAKRARRSWGERGR